LVATREDWCCLISFSWGTEIRLQTVMIPFFRDQELVRPLIPARAMEFSADQLQIKILNVGCSGCL